MASLSRLLKSPVLFLGIAIVAAFLVFKNFQQHEGASLTERVQFLKGSSRIATHSAPASAPTPEAPAREVASAPKVEEHSLVAPATAPATTMAVAAEIPKAPAASPTVAGSPTAAAAKAAISADEPSVFVYYAEVPVRSLQKIFEESQATGQFNSFGDYTAGILPDMEKRIHSKSLEIKFAEPNPVNISRFKEGLFTGVHDAELKENIGLTTFIELTEAENNNFSGRLDIIRAWRERAENGGGVSVQKTSFPAIFELNHGAGFFIAGVLPQKTNPSLEQGLASESSFQILKSQQFQSKLSEFVIFIEFRKKP
jgi:hypothetical protein